MSQAGAISRGHPRRTVVRMGHWPFRAFILFSALCIVLVVYVMLAFIIYMTVFVLFLGNVPPTVYWTALFAAYVLHHAVTLSAAVQFGRTIEQPAQLVSLVLAAMGLAFYPLLWALRIASVCNEDGCYGSNSEPAHVIEAASWPAIKVLEFLFG